jgi:hypothetical protein
VQQVREVDPAALPVVDRLVGAQQLRAPDELLEARTPSVAMIWRTSSATKKK